MVLLVVIIHKDLFKFGMAQERILVNADGGGIRYILIIRKYKQKPTDNNVFCGYVGRLIESV